MLLNLLSITQLSRELFLVLSIKAVAAGQSMEIGYFQADAFLDAVARAISRQSHQDCQPQNLRPPSLASLLIVPGHAS